MIFSLRASGVFSKGVFWDESRTVPTVACCC